MAAETGLFRSRLALGWLIGGEWRAHPARFVLTALAIAVGVALGFAVHIVNGSALASFDGAVRSVNGAADLSVRAATPLGFDEASYPRIATADGVADASPVITLDAEAGDARFRLLGLDVIRAANVTPSLIGAVSGGPGTGNDAVFDQRAIFLSPAAIAAMHVEVGKTIKVTANGHAVSLRVAGALPAIGEGQAIGTIDIAAAQWLFGRLGKLDRIDLKLADGGRATAALQAALPPGASLATVDNVARQGESLSRAYRVNLDMLALVALLTGGFLVLSAQSLSVARRMRAFALIRTLGLPRQGIVTAVAIEGLAIGTAGAVLGLIGGYALAALALRWFGGDLGAGYFRSGGAGVTFQPAAAVAFFALGLGAATLGSVFPARLAARATPAAALKNSGDLLDPRTPIPWRPAAVLLLGGLLLAFLPSIGGLPLFGFASMALLLAGGLAGVPWLARRLLDRWTRKPIANVPWALAVHHIHGAPGEAATALCGIVASTALMIAMATMVTSFRGAVDAWLGQILSSDLYLRTDGGPGFDPAAQARLRSTNGIERIAFSRQLPLTLRSDRPPVTLIARPVSAARGETLDLIDASDTVPNGATPVWVSEPAQRLYGLKTGAFITLPIGSGDEVYVAGVWRDYARQSGAVAMRGRDYTRLTGDPTRGEAAVTLTPGSDPDAAGLALRTRMSPGLRQSVTIAKPGELRRFALKLFDRSFAVTYVLETVAILVGLAGVAATISAQTVARAREFGMLRHLGVAKRQIIAMLGFEGGLLGLVGGVAGVLLGLVLSQVLIHVVNPQSFNWTMTTRVPIGTIIGVIAALVAAAALTAIMAGRSATVRDAVLAVREDW